MSLYILCVLSFNCEKFRFTRKIKFRIMSQARPYKITDVNGLQKYGVMVVSLQDLIRKAREKFCITLANSVKIVLQSDGTQVDKEDYFTNLTPNTCLSVLKQDEMWIPPSASAVSNEGTIQRLDQLEQEVTLLREEIERQQGEIERQQEEIESQQEEVEKHEGEIESLQEEIENLRTAHMYSS